MRKEQVQMKLRAAFSSIPPCCPRPVFSGAGSMPAMLAAPAAAGNNRIVKTGCEGVDGSHRTSDGSPRREDVLVALDQGRRGMGDARHDVVHGLAAERPDVDLHARRLLEQKWIAQR